mmetsp:Transcript_11899/g.32208  ORF Transcript_11899/g.32208 Transcript_11899/m.32208 type:complete len:109 (+) Transcript_11899:2372-2698(+)
MCTLVKNSHNYACHILFHSLDALLSYCLRLSFFRTLRSYHSTPFCYYYSLLSSYLTLSLIRSHADLAKLTITAHIYLSSLFYYSTHSATKIQKWEVCNRTHLYMIEFE